MDTKAPPQAGVFSGLNPTAVNLANPITLFIIQVSPDQSWIYAKKKKLNFILSCYVLGCYYSCLL